MIVAVTRVVRRLSQGATAILGGGKEDVEAPKPLEFSL